jgi:hypothetical protein
MATFPFLRPSKAPITLPTIHFLGPSKAPITPGAYTLPTIHLNGTGAKSLADEYHAVYQALGRASDALAAATCNARDFYSQGDAAWQQARNERAEMFCKLAEVQSYAEAWMERASDHL